MRNVGIDQLKAISIVGVVLIHVGLVGSEFCRYCVPVFIVAWAYSFECALRRRSPDTHRSYSLQRIWSLLVPYVFWTGFYLVVFRPQGDWATTPWHTIVFGWWGGYGWPGQYFFVILFQLTPLFLVFRKIASARVLIACVIAGILLNALATHSLFGNEAIAKIGDRLFVYWIPYCSLGIMLARKMVSTDWRYLLLAIPALLLGPAEASIAPGCSPYLPISTSIGSLLLCLAWAGESGLSLRPHLAGLLETLGQHTMAIFVSNAALIVWLSQLLPYSGELRKLLITTIVLLLGVLLGQALSRLRLGMLVGAK